MITSKQEVNSIICRARIARLATANSEAKPYVLPLVFAFDKKKYYIPIDGKTKTEKPEKLKRIENIEVNPAVALLIDEYNEDWKKLFFIMIQGKAAIIGKKNGGDEGDDADDDGLLKLAHKLLYAKYLSITCRYWETRYSNLASKDYFLGHSLGTTIIINYSPDSYYLTIFCLIVIVIHLTN